MATGFAAGTLNVLAGGGSFLTLPVLIFLGLPAGLANGTNRVAILLQNLGAIWGFDRHGVLDRRALLWAALPAAAGGVLGAQFALLVSDQDFQRILAFVMIVMTLGTLLSTGRKLDTSETRSQRFPIWALAVGFFAVGVYGGFVQAGVGFLVLAVTTLAGLDLVRGNAVKVLSIFCMTVLALLIFALRGQVHWAYGLALAVGTVAGGQLGVRFTLLKGHRWLRGFVTLTVIFFALRLWWTA